jgi:hypothetical protein
MAAVALLFAATVVVATMVLMIVEAYLLRCVRRVSCVRRRLCERRLCACT